VSQPVTVDHQFYVSVLQEEVARLHGDRMMLAALLRQRDAELAEARQAEVVPPQADE
jgi:hypothetical protein